MDPIKVIIFVGAFLLLLLLGKKLSASEGPYDVPPPRLPFKEAATLPILDQSAMQDSSRLVGSDLPFPIPLPAIERDPDGKYNRPEFLDYYFEHIDLVHGPEDPAVFCDDFCVETRDVETYHAGLYKYLVATPAGLQKVLNSERLPALYIEGQVVVVARWDLPTILDAVVKQIIKGYAEDDDKVTHALPDEDADLS